MTGALLPLGRCVVAALAIGVALAACQQSLPLARVANNISDTAQNSDRASGALADRQVLVTIRDRGSALSMAPGATPRAAGSDDDYRGSAWSQRVNRELQRQYHLQETEAWRIDLLGVYCIVYRATPGQEPQDLVARLAADPRVSTAQVLNEFTTRQRTTDYDDPYFRLQSSLAAIRVPEAQRFAAGRGVHVAVIDTGVDITHPDLASRIEVARNFVGANNDATPPAERHGTAVMGAIAAVANNGIGIVGVAPDAKLWALRGCWQSGAAAVGSCNTLTLARALDYAIARRADVVNLSIAGPRDALLESLVAQALARGMIVVGAWDGPDRFPGAVAGVIAAADADDRSNKLARGAAGLVAVPAREVLTLVPGGRYDYVSGTSMSAALTSGVAALLLSAGREPGADSGQQLPTIRAVLLRSSVALAPPSDGVLPIIDACGALALRLQGVHCKSLLARQRN